MIDGCLIGGRLIDRHLIGGCLIDRHLIGGRLIDRYLIGGHLIGGRLIGGHLIGGHLIGGCLIDGRLTVGRLIDGCLIGGRLIDGCLIGGRLINGHLIGGHKDQFAVSYFSTSIIVLIQVFNWEIQHHSLVCCCGLAVILYVPAYSALNMHVSCMRLAKSSSRRTFLMVYLIFSHLVDGSLSRICLLRCRVPQAGNNPWSPFISYLHQ